MAAIIKWEVEARRKIFFTNKIQFEYDVENTPIISKTYPWWAHHHVLCLHRRSLGLAYTFYIFSQTDFDKISIIDINTLGK